MGYNSDGVIDENQRRSKVGWFQTPGWVSGLSAYYMKLANDQAWKFEVSYQETPQFTIYKKRQFYDFHKDDDTFHVVGGPDIRKLSVVISITDPKEYEGGEFVLGDTEIPELREQGSIIVFPSCILHKAGTVKKGTRYSLVNWFRGPMYR